MIVTLVTAPDLKTARKLGDTLVGERIAACVTVIPGGISTYRWKGKIHRDKEVLLIIKSRNQKKLEARIRKIHPYEVPEILHLDVTSGDSRYLAWIRESTIA